jgi:hypothetical protein
MLRWHLQHGRSPIPKSTKPARVAENVDVFDFELSSDDITALDALDTGVRDGLSRTRLRSKPSRERFPKRDHEPARTSAKRAFALWSRRSRQVRTPRPRTWHLHD